jgi:hypothetical protein
MQANAKNFFIIFARYIIFAANLLRILGNNAVFPEYYVKSRICQVILSLFSAFGDRAQKKDNTITCTVFFVE